MLYEFMHYDIVSMLIRPQILPGCFRHQPFTQTEPLPVETSLDSLPVTQPEEKGTQGNVPSINNEFTRRHRSQEEGRQGSSDGR